MVDTGRRRRWSASEDEKPKIVLESLQAPRQISARARRYGISRSLRIRCSGPNVGTLTVVTMDNSPSRPRAMSLRGRLAGRTRFSRYDRNLAPHYDQRHSRNTIRGRLATRRGRAVGNPAHRLREHGRTRSPRIISGATQYPSSPAFTAILRNLQCLLSTGGSQTVEGRSRNCSLFSGPSSADPVRKAPRPR